VEPVWSWGILGLILLALEMVTGTFYVLWFGISALVLAVLIFLFPGTPLPLQCLLFAGLALAVLFLWRRYYKKNDPDFTIGQAQGEEIGRIGIVIQEVTPHAYGRIQFTQGLMGSREWMAVADGTIPVGAVAIVTAVEGNTLRIKPQ